MQKCFALHYPSPMAGLILNHAWLIQQQRVFSNVRMIYHGRVSFRYCHAKALSWLLSFQARLWNVMKDFSQRISCNLTYEKVDQRLCDLQRVFP